MFHRIARKFFANNTFKRVSAGALFTGLLLKNSLKHVFPEDLFFPFHAYATDEPYIIEAIKLLNQCKNDVGVAQSMKITPFISMTSEVCSAGFAAGNLGQCHIGVPASFFCNNMEELSHQDILMGKISGFKRRSGKRLEKVDENEIRLMKSLLLTKDAQKFAIARHISYLQRNWALYQSIIPSLFVLLGYPLVFHLPRLLFVLSSKPATLPRILITSVFGASAAYVSCKLTKAALMRKILIQADMDAAKVSPQYAKGGIEMYSKLMETGSALRILFGRHGENIYTAEGNIKGSLIPLFNTTSPSFSERIKRLEKIADS